MMTQLSKRSSAQKKCDRPCEDLGELLDHRFFKALCDPSRIAILVHLARSSGPCRVSQVAECGPVDISVVSRHLAMLRDVGILAARKRGKEVHYSVRYPELSATLRAMADAIDACCPVKDSTTKVDDHERTTT